MGRLNFREMYNHYVKSLLTNSAADQSQIMATAIGGEFDAFGIIERELLIQCGLQQDGYVIDVGCGSGRLAKPLAQYLSGPYLGTDIVPDLIDYARQLAGRSDWRFELADGLRIPEVDGVADIVCFFSVFTHLLHEESYIYLQEARRVLKPGGRIIFSFLQFAIPSHWAVFESNLASLGGSHPLNMFVSRDGIEAWAAHLNLRIVEIHDGDKPHISLPHPVTLDDGRVMEGKGNLGQSVCILAKP